MRMTKPAPLNFERLECRRVFAASPIITEFMASNDGALLDGYGAEQDWVEIFNAGDESVDLANFKLTDDPEELDKWSFPGISLEPGQYLVVFASSRDEVDPAGHLHTNFGLSAGGEYLALVDPMGQVVSEFGPSFPAQDSNASYGIGFNSESHLAVGPGSSASYLLPSDGSVDASWMLPGFDDSAWSLGTASLGYQATSGPYAGLYQTTLPVGTQSAYVRIPFMVDSAEEVVGTLRMKYDDGFVAYLNGAEIARKHAPGELSYDAYATEIHPREAAIVDKVLNITHASDLLVLGENVLAIHVMNAANSPTDDLLLASSLMLSSGTPITPTVVGSMMAPTPGAPNTNVQAGEVVFSRVGGAFINPFALELSPSVAGEVIRYTLDGTDPTESSLLYVGPIDITTSDRVRARAFGSNGEVGKVYAEGYTAAELVSSNFTSDLPIILLDTFGTGRPDREYKDAIFSLYDVNQSTGRSSLVDLPTLTSPIGHHRRGSTTYGSPKPSLRIEFRDERGEDKDVELLGMPAESDWILYAPFNQDRSMIRNTVMYDLSGQVVDYAIRTRFVEVFYNLYGGGLATADYMGVYVLMENIKRDENRVAIDQLTPADTTAPEISGGYIIKVDRADLEEDSTWDTPGVPASLSNLVHVEPERAEMTQAQVDYIRGYISDFETALFGSNWLDPEIGYEAYIDVDSWIDHHLLRVFSRDGDVTFFSEYLYKSRGGKLTFGPAWDFDRSAGSEGAGFGAAEGWTPLKAFNYGWWGRLFSDPNFKQKWIDRWQELRETVYSDANLVSVVTQHSAELDEAQARNAVRWPAVAPNGGAYADGGLEGWDAEISNLKNWLLERAEWIDEQFVAPPTIVIESRDTPGPKEVTLDSHGGTIYYTLDGSDPRASGGGVSPNALIYSGPLMVGQGEQIKARVYSAQGDGPIFTPWSWAVSETLEFKTGYPLRIVELMYNPPGSADDTEYFELLNTGTETIQLAGVRITEFSGGGFTFASGSLAPGERIVVVKDQEAFAASHPHVTNLAAGEFSGSLSNEGELVGLLDPQGIVIQWFVYGDSNVSGWPELPDGEGYSLEYIGPLNAGEDPLNGAPGDPFDNPTNWRASLQEGGSPGAGDEEPEPPSGDFDGDGDVDGRDFLAWQHGYGKPSATKADGDADNDSDVDADDLLTWQEQYGTPETLLVDSGSLSADINEDQQVSAAVRTLGTPDAVVGGVSELPARFAADVLLFWLSQPTTSQAEDTDREAFEEIVPIITGYEPADLVFADFDAARSRCIVDFGDIAVTRNLSGKQATEKERVTGIEGQL